MEKKQEKFTRIMVWSVSCLVALIFLGGAFGIIKVLLSEDSGKRKRQLQMVTLLKPPPPPKIQEKPPEPEIEKKEEIIEQQEETEPDPMDDMAEDEGPLDDDLGLDADGTAGSDSFGLKGKKGGRALIAGSGDRTLLQRYAWYTHLIQEEIRKRINDYMAGSGGVPKGEHKALVQIVLDSQGRIIDYKLQQSSGNKRVDQALRETLLVVRLSEMPPEGMPRSIKLKVSSRG